MKPIDELRKSLRYYANPEKVKFFPRFFKTGPGEYGEGDKFIGVTVPNMRKVAKQFKDLLITDIKTLLYSPIHEKRQVALIILTYQFAKADEKRKKRIYDFYLAHTKQVNNWDLVDSSANKIVGGYLLDKKDKTILTRLARSKNLWEKRIAMIATYQFIKEKREYEDAFKIATILLHDKHDLIHKAVGWMLREVGKQISHEKEEEFLNKHYKTMPRTMLRYAIEHFPDNKRKFYMRRSVY